MDKIILDPATMAKLCGLTGQAELCDPSGHVVGFFVPVLPPSAYKEVEVPFTEEELDRIEAKGLEGRPLKDILKDLEEQS